MTAMPPRSPSADPQPCPALRFDAGERLLVEAARSWWRLGTTNYLFDRRLTAALGPDGAETLARPLHGLLTALSLYARRPVGLRAPGDPMVSADERALVGLVAAAGAGDAALTAMRLAWLLDPRIHGAAAVAAERTGRVLDAYGFALSAVAGRRGTGPGRLRRTEPAADAAAEITSTRRSV
jgi:hypothetical protein